MRSFYQIYPVSCDFLIKAAKAKANDNLMHHNSSDTPWIWKRQFPNFGHKNDSGQSRIFNEIQHPTGNVLKNWDTKK